MVAPGGVRLALVLVLTHAHAHAGAQTRFTYSRGQSVSPAYEGWWQNDDGSYTMFFGYMNSNWEEELDVPVGPDNHIEPGGPDRASRRTSIPAATCSCSRWRSRPTSATTRSSGR